MKKLPSILPRWLPAVVMMILIFTFSQQPAERLPHFFNWDFFVKKAGHVAGYGLLALSYLHFFNYDKKRYWLSWLLAFLFSAMDEFHQSFTPGRNASIYDILIFDNLGAALALSSFYFYRRNYEKENQSA